MLNQDSIAARMAAIQPFHVMAILARAKQLQAQGRDIFHLEVGEPDFPTPAPIIEAGIKALQQGQTRYTPACGIPVLREAIAQYYHERFGVRVDPKRIIITPGASGALQLVLSTLLNPQDEVLIPDPAYPCNRHFVRLFDANPISIPAYAATNYQLTVSDIEQYWSARTKLVMLATPSNPTGTALNKDELQALYAAVKARNGQLLVDEIYQGLLYDGEEHTALALGDDVWVINSFSKYFGMTGWRLGWIVAPEWAVEAIDRLAQNVFLCPSTPAQYAALAAFTPEARAIMEANKQVLKARRDFLVPALGELGLVINSQPVGAFYVYADAGRFTQDAQALCLQLLEQVGVAVTPGIDFGEFEANTHIRFAYTTDVLRLEQAMEQLRRYLPHYY
ncbi:pyridoxal phosphate-dependent aminotransferase [Thiofilum flexile]|uniref:pyridoxal phosphate-dependent aminotransferase n=1 Tax=Thiofilum flexile TaxID=125627 RepID=UPI00036362D0|nr:pyridoxal phosphate-dependent aminotransferase [Thiofilum flexile]